MKNKHTHICIHPKTIKIEPCIKNDIFFLIFIISARVCDMVRITLSLLFLPL